MRCPECLKQDKIENENNAPEMVETLSEDAKMVFSGNYLQPAEHEYKIILVCPDCDHEIETNKTQIQ